MCVPSGGRGGCSHFRKGSCDTLVSSYIDCGWYWGVAAPLAEGVGGQDLENVVIRVFVNLQGCVGVFSHMLAHPVPEEDNGLIILRATPSAAGPFWLL